MSEASHEETRTGPCAAGYRGSIGYRRTVTLRSTRFPWDEAPVTQTVYGAWTVESDDCRREVEPGWGGPGGGPGGSTGERRRLGGPGPMCGTSGPGRAKRRQRCGTASRSTARRRIRRAIWRASAAGCTATAMPGSASSPAPVRSARSPAWRMSGAGLPWACSGVLRCPCCPGLGDRGRGAGTDRRALRHRGGGPRAAARPARRDSRGQV